MKYLTYLIIILATIGFLFMAISNMNDSAAQRMRAEATLIRAQSAARQDLLAGLMPYVIFGTVTIVGLGLGAIVIYALAQQPRPETYRPQHIIETRTILILQPGEHSRREIYKLLGSGDKTI